jgi:hypothetical protein
MWWVNPLRSDLQGQIEQHQKVLETLEQQLLPSARNPQLRAHLQSMRPIIQQHLEAARDAQQALNKAGQRSGGASGASPAESGGTGTTGGGGAR